MYHVEKIKTSRIIEIATVLDGVICAEVKPGFVIIDDDGNIITGKHPITGKFFVESYRQKRAAQMQCDYLNRILAEQYKGISVKVL